MKRLYQTLLTILLVFFIFANTVHADCCNAGFSSFHLPQSSGLNAFQFEMNDSSATDIQYVEWAFGDGTYSNLTNPIHLYNYSGTYSVILTVFKQMVGGVQKSCTETHELSVESTCSNFIYNKTNRTVAFIQTAAFNIDSTSSWIQSRTFLWTFDDGQTSNELNPIHTYAQVGSYTACLYQFRKDSAFVDSCYTCQSFLIQDTIPVATCNAAFSYEVDGSNVYVHSLDSLNTYYWSVLGDSSRNYAENAQYNIPSNSGITICHRQYGNTLLDSISNYCEECKTIYSIPKDTTYVKCHSDFTYTLGDSSVNLHPMDIAYTSRWWMNVNDVDQGMRYSGTDTTIFLPASGKITVCHLQYNDSLSSANSDSCIVCKVIRLAQDSVVVTKPICHSDFDYTIFGNTVTVFSVGADSIIGNRQIWKFSDTENVYDTLLANHTYTSPGAKRICLTTFTHGYIDTCQTCKDILIEAADISIYPNPAVHNINVQSKDGTIASIEIYNINGIKVKNIFGLNVDKYTIEVPDLASGIYNVSTVLTDGRTKKVKVIVQ
jgi:PKD repeat protein